jgi:hypothetical protein
MGLVMWPRGCSGARARAAAQRMRQHPPAAAAATAQKRAAASRALAGMALLAPTPPALTGSASENRSSLWLRKRASLQCTRPQTPRRPLSTWSGNPCMVMC